MLRHIGFWFSFLVTLTWYSIGRHKTISRTGHIHMATQDHPLSPFKPSASSCGKSHRLIKYKGHDRLIGSPYRPYNCNSSFMLREIPEILSLSLLFGIPWISAFLFLPLASRSLSVSYHLLRHLPLPSDLIICTAFPHHKFVIVRLWLPALSSAWPHHLCLSVNSQPLGS